MSTRDEIAEMDGALVCYLQKWRILPALITLLLTLAVVVWLMGELWGLDEWPARSGRSRRLYPKEIVTPTIGVVLLSLWVLPVLALIGHLILRLINSLPDLIISSVGICRINPLFRDYGCFEDTYKILAWSEIDHVRVEREVLPKFLRKLNFTNLFVVSGGKDVATSSRSKAIPLRFLDVDIGNILGNLKTRCEVRIEGK